MKRMTVVHVETCEKPWLISQENPTQFPEGSNRPAIWFVGGHSHCINKYESLETRVRFWLCNSKGILMVLGGFWIYISPNSMKVRLVLQGIVGKDYLVVSDVGLCYLLNVGGFQEVGYHVLIWWISKQSKEIRQWKGSFRAKRALGQCKKQEFEVCNAERIHSCLVQREYRNECKQDSNRSLRYWFQGDFVRWSRDLGKSQGQTVLFLLGGGGLEGNDSIHHKASLHIWTDFQAAVSESCRLLKRNFVLK